MWNYPGRLRVNCIAVYRTQQGEKTMRMKFGIAVVAALLAAPVAVHAQGVIGGMQRGAG